MHVNPDDPRLPREQIADDLRTRIRSGELPPGKRLPPIRELAATAGVSPNTVQAALSLLKREGLIVTSSSRGTFVAPSGAADS